jgi:hypothetical protein
MYCYFFFPKLWNRCFVYTWNLCFNNAICSHCRLFLLVNATFFATEILLGCLSNTSREGGFLFFFRVSGLFRWNFIHFFPPSGFISSTFARSTTFIFSPTSHC